VLVLLIYLFIYAERVNQQDECSEKKNKLRPPSNLMRKIGNTWHLFDSRQRWKNQESFTERERNNIEREQLSLWMIFERFSGEISILLIHSRVKRQKLAKWNFEMIPSLINLHKHLKWEIHTHTPTQVPELYR